MAPSTELKNGFCESAAATKQNGHLISKNEFQMEVKNDINNEVRFSTIIQIRINIFLTFKKKNFVVLRIE